LSSSRQERVTRVSSPGSGGGTTVSTEVLARTQGDDDFFSHGRCPTGKGLVWVAGVVEIVGRGHDSSRRGRYGAGGHDADGTKRLIAVAWLKVKQQAVMAQIR